ncbi:MAG: hypothetical protein NT166_03275 [Candidatus Aminicenantes bacterium]|nr:hypothetical protein [Candidatus Aminicenantes bacterium]
MRKTKTSSPVTGNPVLNPNTIIKKNGPGAQTEYIVGLSYKKFFKVGEIEYEILQLLDGAHSPDAIRQEFLEVRDVDIPIERIQAFINELGSLELVSFDAKIKTERYLHLTLPDFIYRWFSVLYRPVPLAASMVLGLVGLIFFILDTREIFTFITPYYSFHFVGIFILVYLVTSFFHELGHGAAIRYFNYKPGPIQIKRGNGLFFLHFSTPFIIYSPDKIIDRKLKLTIISGGIIFDFLVLVVGAALFRATAGGILKAAGVLLQLTALSRIVLSINFFNENTDLAKLLVYYFEPCSVESTGSAESADVMEGEGAKDASFKKHFLYKAIGTLLWLLQYSVFFFIIYMILYSVRARVTLPFPVS